MTFSLALSPPSPCRCHTSQLLEVLHLLPIGNPAQPDSPTPSSITFQPPALLIPPNLFVPPKIHLISASPSPETPTLYLRSVKMTQPMCRAIQTPIPSPLARNRPSHMLIHLDLIFRCPLHYPHPGPVNPLDPLHHSRLLFHRQTPHWLLDLLISLSGPHPLALPVPLQLLVARPQLNRFSPLWS